ncbi:hypothetical protein [Halomicrobium urmianum]|uniref:hypothetical protein n=1 Tax=Halomicrobium urmianum TaxID=1586233 RepID=UPI001CDA1616|nr:hypothetical protein [Halomicrobium urmianum]
MLNRVDIANAFGSGSTAAEVDADRLAPLLAEGEAVQAAAASAEGIEHATDDRTTTIEPEDGSHAYAVATNRRIHFLLGGEPESPEITYRLAAVTGAELRDGLLSSTLHVRTADESVRFSPVDADRAEALASYVSRVGSAWADLEGTLAGAREAMAEARETIRAGEDPTGDVQRAQMRLSKAHHCATHDDAAPTELMEAAIEPIEDELENLQVVTWTDRVAELLEDARKARASGDYDAAFEVAVEAADRIDAAREALGDSEADASADSDLAGTIEDLSADLEAVAADLFDEAEDACHVGLDTDDPAEAVAAWEDALDRYRAALAADWAGAVGPDPEALRFQLAWVVGNLIDALVAAAEECERAGDDLGEDHDDSADRYEAARDWLRRAHRLAREHPHSSGAALEEPLDRVQEKFELAQWQWGTAD